MNLSWQNIIYIFSGSVDYSTMSNLCIQKVPHNCSQIEYKSNYSISQSDELWVLSAFDIQFTFDEIIENLIIYDIIYQNISLY
jgi:hypothetical protein